MTPAKTILVDGRSLLDPRGGGVFEYARNLVEALRRQTSYRYLVWSNQFSAVPASGVDSMTRIPNKILHAGIRFASWPKIDRLGGGGDLVWAPNLHFVAATDGLPFVLTVHDLSFEKYPEFFSPRQRLWHRAVDPRRLAARADAVLAVSEHTKNDLIERYGIDPGKITVACPGVFPSKEIREAGLEEMRSRLNMPGRFILHLGAFEPRKNHLALLDAYRLLKSRPGFSDVGLVLAGPSGWNNRGILRAIETHPYRSEIIRLGFVAPDERAALYRLAAVFAFPSFYEGFGLPPLEAMSAGTPVVASFAASLGEVIADAGLLTDPYRPAELADALAAVLESPALAETLAMRGRARAARFTWEACAEKTVAAFDQLLR